MSFFSAVKAAGAAAAAKVKAEANRLKSLPTKALCSGCKVEIMVPPETFLWDCAACKQKNEYAAEACSKCQTPKPDKLVYRVQCGACGAVVEVPTTQAAASAKIGAHNTKVAAAAAVEATKKQVKHWRQDCETFPCSNCNTQLVNPNQVDQPGGQEEPASGDPAPSQQAAPPRIEKVQCGVCGHIVSVPGSNFTADVRGMAGNSKASLQRTYYKVASKRHTDCPQCKNPMQLPDWPPKDQAAQNDDEAEGPPGGVPVAHGPPPITTVKCTKCSHEFQA